MQNRAKLCKIVQNCAAKVKMIQKRASQGFLDPIQKRALSRSVQLEAVYLEALLYSLSPYYKRFLLFFSLQVTKMLSIVVVLFGICWLPFQTFNFLSAVQVPLS